MNLPIYQHPSLTVLIDDSDNFLRSLSFQLDPTLASKAFHDTRSALHWLRQQSGPCTGAERTLSASFDAYPREVPQYGVALDLEQIHRISFQRKRFLTPSVVVVDYLMPQMNGIELCEAIRDLPCKKILFTGVADERVAVDAFNRGLIDRYIKKSDENALDRLEREIETLQRDFFTARSEPLRDLLALHSYSFVSDPAVATLVRELVAERGIVEHYLYQNPAGLLMYDTAGKPLLLVMETEAGMNAHYEIANDNNAPQSLLDALQERRVIPYFRDGDGMYTAAYRNTWHRYIEAAQVCRGEQTYFWALFELSADQLPGEALSYNDFLRNHQVTY
ncbi:response regulator [Massilia cavernae]|uniref:Response regulator n=1 Tax=Massilia cavernae TaxID=2320864 RepID=A0A418X810_9BURK|nr:response regulator [Massilia cavernae]RJG08538.1 response regulator [Massilia cavernae]